VTDFQDFAEKVADFQKNGGPLAKKVGFPGFLRKSVPAPEKCARIPKKPEK